TPLKAKMNCVRLKMAGKPAGIDNGCSVGCLTDTAAARFPPLV
ncbi:hypothetical protein HMPREF9080_02331, partial [Cardiobacterium valvarum F0432]